MTNKEKMLQGEYYISLDEELSIERERAKDLLFEFNNTKPSFRAEREAMIQKLFGKVIIGNNVWIGGGVTILGGVKIGANSVVGAGSVVVKDIPEGVVAVGNPAKAIRKITDEDRIEKITRLV